MAEPGLPQNFMQSDDDVDAAAAYAALRNIGIVPIFTRLLVLANYINFDNIHIICSQSNKIHIGIFFTYSNNIHYSVDTICFSGRQIYMARNQFLPNKKLFSFYDFFQREIIGESNRNRVVFFDKFYN